MNEDLRVFLSTVGHDAPDIAGPFGRTFAQEQRAAFPGVQLRSHPRAQIAGRKAVRESRRPDGVALVRVARVPDQNDGDRVRGILEDDGWLSGDDGIDNYVEESGAHDLVSFVDRRNLLDQGLVQGLGDRVRSSGILGSDDDVRAEGAEFGGEATLGVDLEIEQGSGDGGSCAQSKKNNEEATAIGAEQVADDAPEHCAICGVARGHHSPRRIGAGSYREARRRGMALPSRVTRAARARITKRTSTEGAGAAPKILSPTKRARRMPSA